MRPLVFSDTITIRTDRELREAIDSAAAREETSASDWIRRALASVAMPACPSGLALTHARAGDAAATTAHG